MRPRPGEVLHFSEDPTITCFDPHVAATAREAEAYVWAVDDRNAPSYWFPRQCPRAMAWTSPATLRSDRDRIIGVGGGERVHAIEYGWLEALRTTELFAYRFDADGFRPLHEASWVSTLSVTPLGPPEPVGDLLKCHEEAGIQLRLLPNLWAFWDEVIVSTLDFSGIRLRNALPPRG